MKDSAPFLGVPMADIRSAVHRQYEQELRENLEGKDQVDFALNSFALEHSEGKLAGTLLLEEGLIPAGLVSCRDHLDRLAGWFRPGGIYDWDIWDWFSVKVLASLNKKGREALRRGDLLLAHSPGPLAGLRLPGRIHSRRRGPILPPFD